jgi:hypothetical protein
LLLTFFTSPSKTTLVVYLQGAVVLQQARAQFRHTAFVTQAVCLNCERACYSTTAPEDHSLSEYM